MAFSKFGRARIAREMPPRTPSAYSIKWRRRVPEGAGKPLSPPAKIHVPAHSSHQRITVIFLFSFPNVL